MTIRYLSTILAALRFWQRVGNMSAAAEKHIATCEGTLAPLDAGEIDHLCELLNTGELTITEAPQSEHTDSASSAPGTSAATPVRLTMDMSVAMNGTSPEALRQVLYGLVDLANANGLITGETDAELESIATTVSFPSVPSVPSATPTTEAAASDHPIFSTPIQDDADARALLDYLYLHDLNFHPDDDPADLFDRKFDKEASDLLLLRMDEIAELPDFDPCAYYLDISGFRNQLHPSVPSVVSDLAAALSYLKEQTVDMDLAHGIELTEGEAEARAMAIAALAKA